MQDIDATRSSELHALRFGQQGFTHVRDAIPPELLVQLRERFDRQVRALSGKAQRGQYGSVRPGCIELQRLFETEPLFSELIDLPTIYATVTSLSAEPLFLAQGGLGHELAPGANAHVAWHFDGIPAFRCTYLIDDVDPEMGAMALMPGSHLARCQAPAWFNENGDDPVYDRPRRVPGAAYRRLLHQ